MKTNIQKQTAQKAMAMVKSVYRFGKLDVAHYNTLDIEKEVNNLVVSKIGVESRTSKCEVKIAI